MSSWRPLWSRDGDMEEEEEEGTEGAAPRRFSRLRTSLRSRGGSSSTTKWSRPDKAASSSARLVSVRVGGSDKVEAVRPPSCIWRSSKSDLLGAEGAEEGRAMEREQTTRMRGLAPWMS